MKQQNTKLGWQNISECEELKITMENHVQNANRMWPLQKNKMNTNVKWSEDAIKKINLTLKLRCCQKQPNAKFWLTGSFQSHQNAQNHDNEVWIKKKHRIWEFSWIAFISCNFCEHDFQIHHCKASPACCDFFHPQESHRFCRPSLWFRTTSTSLSRPPALLAAFRRNETVVGSFLLFAEFKPSKVSRLLFGFGIIVMNHIAVQEMGWAVTNYLISSKRCNLIIHVIVRERAFGEQGVQ